MVKLTVIIVNYNVKYFIEQALLSVRKAKHSVEEIYGQQSVEVIVVDNQSSDGSVTMIRENFAEVKVIANENNVGFSIANNQAIDIANGTYVLLLNPDTLVQEDTFLKCLKFCETHSDLGGLGVAMIDGNGQFLPESKRGLPTPWASFCKLSGVSRLFPRTKLFNRYHLGYLDADKNHEIEILSGAFMWMKKSVLDEVGLLDEQFFMYGEDIDLSYRIIQAGYKNYYCSDTSIIHYKGESTKKGSLNYVRMFHKAMSQFAKKHFDRNPLLSFIFELGIYIRAGITLIQNFVANAFWPVVDFILILVGFFIIKEFWETTVLQQDHYYSDLFLQFNVPLYAGIWIVSHYFNGIYLKHISLRRYVRSVIIGLIIIAALYGFINEEFRFSRGIIITGALWTLIIPYGVRVLAKQFNRGPLYYHTGRKYAIIGSEQEANRVKVLMDQSNLTSQFVGFISPSNQILENSIGSFEALEDLVSAYRINELIFCNKDISSSKIIGVMTEIGDDVQYKIVPEESISIIGSNSKNTSGDLYAIDVQLNLNEHYHKRNKRLFDLFVCVTFPIWWLIIGQKSKFLKNIIPVFFGAKSWLGYNNVPPDERFKLPHLKPSVFAISYDATQLEIEELKRQNFHYAKSYTFWKEFELLNQQ